MSMPPPIEPCAALNARRRAPAARRMLASGLAACCALTAFALAAPAGAQQAGSGQIYIPGPGERVASAPGAAQGVAAGNAADATSGVITIPGPGERMAQGGTQASASTALPREPVGQAGQRVMPVVVTSTPRATRPAQPVVVDRPASATSVSIVSIDPLAARGEPPRLGASAGAQTAASARTAQPAQPVTPSPSSPSVPAAAVTSPVPAQDSAAPAGQQDGESIRRAAQAFLEQQAVGLPGKATITVAPAFARGLAACTTLVPFMPPGARAWGRTTVGVRCTGAHPWTLYLQARVTLEAAYYLAARQIEPGVVLTAADLTTREGDLANLPRTIVTDASQAVGAVALARIGAGIPLRQDMLRSATSVTIGQTVRVVAVGPGFTITSEGSVMNNATPGQQVRVKTPGGQVISGIVKDGSTVEIQM